MQPRRHINKALYETNTTLYCDYYAKALSVRKINMEMIFFSSLLMYSINFNTINNIWHVQYTQQTVHYTQLTVEFTQDRRL